MASIIYLEIPNGGSWHLVFWNRKTGAEFGFPLGTRDEGEAELIRRRVDLGIYMGMPAIVEGSIPRTIWDKLPRRKWLEAILDSERGEI